MRQIAVFALTEFVIGSALSGNLIIGLMSALLAAGICRLLQLRRADRRRRAAPTITAAPNEPSIGQAVTSPAGPPFL